MLVISGSRISQPTMTTATTTAIPKTYFFIGISFPTRDFARTFRRDAACRVSRCAQNRRGQARLSQTRHVLSQVYSPEAAVGAGCKLERREIVATIISERNCIVATSLLSNAWGVD